MFSAAAVRQASRKPYGLAIHCFAQKDHPMCYSSVTAPAKKPAATAAAPADHHKHTVTTQFAVNIKGHEEVGAGEHKHVEFGINVTKTQSWVVYQRYSAFEAMYKQLLKTYPGATLPPLPTTSLVRSFESDYLNNKAQKLDAFLRELLAHPEVGSDPALLAFIGTPRTHSESSLSASISLDSATATPLVEPEAEDVPPAVSVPTTAPAAERVSGRESRQASMFARAQGTRLGIGLHARASVPVEHDKAITALSNRQPVVLDTYASWKEANDIISQTGTFVVSFPNSNNAELIVNKASVATTNEVVALAGTTVLNGHRCAFRCRLRAGTLGGTGNLVPVSAETEGMLSDLASVL